MNFKPTKIVFVVSLLFSSQGFAQDYTTAREVLNANLEATGGASNWAEIGTITSTGSRELDMPMGARESTFIKYDLYPGYSRTEETIESPMGSMEQLTISTPEGRWTTAMGGRRELPASTWISTESAKYELLLLSDDRVELMDLETEIGDTGPEYVLSFKYEGETYQRKYNQFTLFLTAAEAPGNDGSKNWTTFDDYQEVDGLQIPHTWESVASITINRGTGNNTSTITVVTHLESISFNDSLSDDLFAEE